VIYYAGRIFQLIGLLAMPSAMWVAHFERDERASIAIFVASILVFAMGTLITKFSGKPS